MDLSKRAALDPSEKLGISQSMQVVLLDEIGRSARFSVGDAAFHGGTGISSSWGSQRWSEDLDFLVDRDLRERLMGHVPAIASALRLRIEMAMPGSKVEFQVKRGDDASEDVMDVWLVKWGHPNRHGKALVKAEFYAADRGLLAGYAARLARPEIAGTAVSAVIPVAELVSLWADKAKAIATRPEFKWRDAHDLAFVADSLDRRGWPDAERLCAALTTTAAIYSKTLDDVRDGLEGRIASGLFADRAAFAADMAKWFPAAVHADFAGRGLFDQMLARAGEEVGRAVSLAASETPGRRA